MFTELRHKINKEYILGRVMLLSEGKGNLSSAGGTGETYVGKGRGTPVEKKMGAMKKISKA